MALQQTLAVLAALFSPPARPRAWQPFGTRIALRWLLIAVLSAPFAARADLPTNTIRLPPGFRINVLASDVPGAREMALSPRGILYVASFSGQVYALPLHDGHASTTHVIASRLEMPIGVAWSDGALYVSAVSRILRLDDIDAHLANPPRPTVITASLPPDTQHGGKFIAFGPDGKLYVPVGAPCNVCLRDRDRYAMIGRMDSDGSHFEVVARGVRNTVGFAWQPGTNLLWFTDNGRDMLGDDIPDDKLNVAPRAGLDFGYPFCHAGDVPDPQFGAKKPCSAFTRPAAKLGAHVAALGMRFYEGTMFPEDYRGNIFIAEHGSWNRSSKVGYRVVRIVLDHSGKVTRQELFAHGWLHPNQAVWGRPADVLPLPDGSLLISDDYAGAIYRITFSKP